ncbi:unnamed protein product [Macrosiphum euphorbiae]|uniref:Uncharacterized protein n=1 Tax=Macrosiphum euphorbiae TaxID=13131 RepID=A0AAV0X2S4_9HEMI|nr:unnamed protein product [Macrosiphum euphorbiae]
MSNHEALFTNGLKQETRNRLSLPIAIRKADSTYTNSIEYTVKTLLEVLVPGDNVLNDTAEQSVTGMYAGEFRPALPATRIL